MALCLPAALFAQSGPSRDEVLQAMRQAASFYRNQVSTGGGYHFYYAADLSYGRSESSEGPTQIEFQRSGTPVVALAYLEAYDATKDKLFLDAAQAAGSAYLRGQLCSGGWDYSVEFDPEKRKRYQYRSDKNCGPDKLGSTTLDDNVTQSAVRVMMRLDKALNFQDKQIHEAVLFALDKLIEAQYPIGAWPQRFAKPPDHSKFPVKRASYPATWDRKWPGPDYRLHYTFNDNSISDMIDTMLEAARIYNDPRYKASAEKGGQFILMAQMPDPQPAWAQQYDVNMHPAWARIFEPPSVTGGESQGIMQTLMVLYRETGDRKYLEPIPRALAYLKKSILPAVDRYVEARSRIPKGTPVLARFYELKTNRPLYITKGSRLVTAGQGSRLVDGYELSYSDESSITHYGVLTSGAGLARIEKNYSDLVKADPKTIRRSEKLTGLSPWSQELPPELTKAQRAAKAAQIISALDSRGAWITEGSIGKADRLVFVYAAKDMVLRIGRRSSDGSAGNRSTSQDQVIKLKENDTVEIFQGEEPPRGKILNSELFARNIEALAGYYRLLQ